MARNRMIKKEFWTSEQIMNLPIEARLLFIGMWNQADDEGILKNSPMQLKAQIFPCDMEIDIDTIKSYLNQINQQKLIVFNEKSENEDQDLIRIRKWSEHQRIDRATPTKYNFLDEKQEDSTNALRGLDEDSTRKEVKEKLKESKLKEKKVNQKKVRTAANSTKPELARELDLFNQWWKFYDRDTQKAKALVPWKKIDANVYLSIIAHTKKFVVAVEKRFRPHGYKYLKDAVYLDEIIGDTPGLRTDLNADKKHEARMERQRDEERKATEAFNADPITESEKRELLGLPVKQNGSVDAEDSPKTSNKSTTLSGTLRVNKMSEEGTFKSLGSIIGHE